jgi:hypothetical protein
MKQTDGRAVRIKRVRYRTESGLPEVRAAYVILPTLETYTHIEQYQLHTESSFFFSFLLSLNFDRNIKYKFGHYYTKPSNNYLVDCANNFVYSPLVVYSIIVRMELIIRESG